MCDPITLVKKATPAWFFKIHDIEALKIAPCPDLTARWSVWGVLSGGECTDLEGFTTREAAEEFTLELGRHWPHLAAKG